MEQFALNDRDIFALCQVLNKALNEAECCFEGVRHARVVTLKLQQYVEQRLGEEESGYIEQLKLNL